MSSKVLTLLVIILAAFLIGCDDCNDYILVEDTTPATPQNVRSVTGDRVVWVYWNGIYEHDVQLYIVYRSPQATTGYVEVGRVAAVANQNLDLLIYEFADGAVANGSTYWYAVTSVDHAGQESDLSAENVFDTPRPEGITSLYPTDLNPTLAGFYLAGGFRLSSSSPNADIWMDRDLDDIYYLNVGNEATDIQDLGYTSNFDEISYAPELGWSDLGYIEIILGHTYVIWTDDYHFAKMRAVSFDAEGTITFQWAWQSDQSNDELCPGYEKPAHVPGYVKYDDYDD